MVSYRTLCERAKRWSDKGLPWVGWYDNARNVIGTLAPAPENYKYLSDLVAITSPRCLVKQNLRRAWSIYQGGKPEDGMIPPTLVALEHYHKTGEIRGPKTSRFARVLNGANNVVVVDSWIARAIGVRPTQARNKGTQVLAERIIGVAARRHGVSLVDAQAIVWCGYILDHYKNPTIPVFDVAYVMDTGIPF